MSGGNDIATRRTRKEEAEYVISSVKSLGLKLHPTSRLMQMHNVLTGDEEIIQRDHPGFEAALEAVRDMQVLAFVFDKAAAAPSDTEFKSLVGNALKDSLLPQDDLVNSKGRNAQFELFVAAICQGAGMLPVCREEPDVTCVAGGIKFSIAAKRVKNVARLKERIRNAANQIQKAGFPGIIALDTCVALNRDNDRIETPLLPDEFRLLYHYALNSFIGDNHDTILKCVREKNVCGVVFHDQQVRLQPNNDWMLYGMNAWLCTATEDHCANRMFSIFKKQYCSGIPNMDYFG